MTGINNFITDLMERMRQKEASTLTMPVDGFCVYKKKGGTVFGTHHRGKIELEELAEDFDALGIDVRISGIWYYRHDPTGSMDAESLYYSVMITKSPNYHVVDVAFIAEPDRLFKDILRDNNPVTRQEYHEYAY